MRKERFGVFETGSEGNREGKRRATLLEISLIKKKNYCILFFVVVVVVF